MCGYRRQTGALTVEAGLVAAAWSADLDDSGAVAAVLVHVRATLQAAVRKVQDDFLGSAESGEVDADPLGTASVLAFGALQAVQEAVPAYRRRALAMLGRSDEAEAEAEARRAYRTEQGRRWFRHNPNGADALAAATKAADAARSAPRSSCWRRGWSGCASRPPPGRSRPRPRRGQTGCLSSPPARWTAPPPGR